MSDQEKSLPLTRRAIREAERAAAQGLADLAVLAPAQAFTAAPTAPAADMAVPDGVAPSNPGTARWFPRTALLGALGAATIVFPLAGGAQPAAFAANATPTAATASAASEPGVVDSLTSGGAVLEAASALTADPTAATRAMTTASRAYLREALECPVESGANGTLSAVMGGEEVEQVVMPVAEGTYRITSPYGFRTYPITGMHEGTDFAGSLDTPLYAVADGVVTYAGGGRDGRSGQIVIIESEVNGQTVEFWYGHMYTSGVYVTEGEEVVAGEAIGGIGNNGNSTGPHLHFEVHPGGNGTLETTDPLVWLEANGAQSVAAARVCA